MGSRNLRERKNRNRVLLEEQKDYLKEWLGLGGDWSALELLVMCCAKLDMTARGDIHPHQQLKKIFKIVKSKSDCRTSKIKTKKDFYSSRAWRILRYQAFEKYGNRCQCCGAMPSDGITLHVDHIKPRSKHPDLELDLNNLQILCEDCNAGKINQWDTDWRP